ncbi:MAG: class I SAM-dependent methyltransferase [Planctomycetota bacterium]|jgi:SAM-dependent methyltransferase
MSLSEPTPATEPRESRGPGGRAVDRPLSARVEPFDSYWQTPDDVEKGYRSFARYYEANFLPHVPADRSARILVVSCGPGYLVNLLAGRGYEHVLGIDSDAAKIETAQARGLACRTARAFPFVADETEAWDCIVCEQELNHLTIEEMIEFLRLCRAALRPGGSMVVYGLNGANPLVGAENLAHNIDHFSTFTDYSLRQVLEAAGFEDIRTLPLKLYVFWGNPLNYVGLAVTTLLELFFRACFVLYGKKVKVLTKKIAATCRKAGPAPAGTGRADGRP